jgi:hypothetical protein
LACATKAELEGIAKEATAPFRWALFRRMVFLPLVPRLAQRLRIVVYSIVVYSIVVYSIVVYSIVVYSIVVYIVHESRRWRAV